MPTISTTLRLMDRFAQPLQKVTNQVNTVIVALERMRRLIERPANLNLNINTAAINARLSGIHVAPINVTVRLNTALALAQAATLRAQIIARIGTITATIQLSSNITSLLNQLITLVRQLSEAVRDIRPPSGGGGGGGGGGSGGGFGFGGLGGLAAGYLSFAGVGSAMRISDEYVNTKARLDLINDGLQTTDELQSKIFAAADRARGSYADMAGVIGRMGTLASDAFTSNDELIAFSELMQKSFRVGGSSTMEQQAGMYQLSQAMAAGKLQGDEFRSIMENAPMLAAAIADFTGKSKGELKTMSAEGTITADIIKGAMFAAADDINRKFETMPRTFGDIWNEVKNSALQSFGPLIERVNAFLNSDAGVQFGNSLSQAIQRAAEVIDMLLTAMSNVYTFVSSNWSTIEPVMWGIVGVMGAYLAITRAITIAEAIKNAVMNANPYVLIATAIIGLIVWLVKLWQTNDRFAAGLYRAWNSILGFFDQVPIFFAKVGYGIANAFQDAKVKSLQIMEDMINGIIDGINWMIEKLNQIPGVSMKAIGNVEFASQAAAEAEAIRQAGEEAVKTMQGKAAEKAAAREQKVQDMLNDRQAKRAAEEAEQAKRDAEKANESTFKFGGGGGGMPNINKVGEVGKIRDTVDISSEDIKMMRELAEMKNIQNFVTLTPQVSFGDTHVRQDGRSVDEIIANISDQMTEAIASGARGVYA
ncbi:tape measure protein [Cohnella boryungensis]|uniref:Tape measure protein n=1 Tax=Cohnella boryungensis TaxID=768479 RepID=A0ABV8SE19_9BACL